MRLFKLEIPEENKESIKLEKWGIGKPSEISFTMAKGDKDYKFLRLGAPLPLCTKYKYFEVEVLENESDADIVIGLCPEEAFSADTPPVKAKDSYVVFGSTGIVHVNGRKWGETSF